MDGAAKNQGALTTQEFVDVNEIKDGVVYLKSGGLRKVLAVGGVNFDLKSEEEQNLILNSFQSFLNAIDFPIQFFIHSRKINTARYLKKIEALKESEENELLKIQISDYVEFVRSFVDQNAITTKTFFAVVPYSSIAAQVRPSWFPSFGGAAKATSAETLRSENQKSIAQLNQRVDQVITGLETIGLHVSTLDDGALRELFYNMYNPQVMDKETEIEPA